MIAALQGNDIATPRVRLAALLALGLTALGIAVIATADFSRAEVFAACVALIFLVAVAACDAATMRAPNALVYPGALLIPAAHFASGPTAILGALGGGAIAFVVCLALVIAGRGRMGMGDAKFAFLCGAAAGLQGLLLMFGAAFAVGGLVAAVVLLFRVRARNDAIAFTPFLVIGVFAAWALL